ncbi:MAG: hypothetical protein U1A72_12680 [Sulfuritalea sp.]|nr:hypothetical protein [Sulfuritalea sp.]
MTGLVRYEAARAALQAAVSVDEVKDVRDKAQAMAAYAMQAKNTDMILWATEIKVRAERRAGEMLSVMKINGTRKSAADNLKSSPKSDDRTSGVTLDSLEISKNQSADWQKLAAVPESQFEQAITAAKKDAGKVTSAAVRRMTRKEKPKAEPKKKKAKPAPTPDEDYAADMGKELESAAAQITNLQALVESLKKDDLAKEVAKWHLKFDQLEGRLRQSVTSQNEAEKQARYSTGLLAKIRAALKVEKNAHILPAIESCKK